MITFALLFIGIGITISFYYLTKALYYYSLYLYLKHFDKDFKDYKKFTKSLKNDKIKITNLKE